MMGSVIYLLCALTSALCALLLLREYRRTTLRLLLWSGLSFAAMAVANTLVFTDLVLYPQNDLSIARAAIMCVATALLLYGLVWEGD